MSGDDQKANLKELVWQAIEKRAADADARRAIMDRLTREEALQYIEEVILPNAIQTLGMDAETIWLMRILPEELYLSSRSNRLHDQLVGEPIKNLVSLCEEIELEVALDGLDIFISLPSK